MSIDSWFGDEYEDLGCLNCGRQFPSLKTERHLFCPDCEAKKALPPFIHDLYAPHENVGTVIKMEHPKKAKKSQLPTFRTWRQEHPGAVLDFVYGVFLFCDQYTQKLLSRGHGNLLRVRYADRTKHYFYPMGNYEQDNFLIPEQMYRDWTSKELAEFVYPDLKWFDEGGQGATHVTELMPIDDLITEALRRLRATP